MERTYRIVSCSNTVTKDKQGNEINPIHLLKVVDDKGVSSTLVRTPSQLAKDLSNSFLEYSPMHLACIAGERVIGDINPYKVGEKYIANENSTAVKNGSAKVGDEVTHTSDGNYINGFLYIDMVTSKRKELM